MESKMVKKVRQLTLILMLVEFGLSLLFADASISVGVILGAVTALLGFQMIVKASWRYQGERVMVQAGFDYVKRYLIYTVIFALAVYRGINVFAILGGFLCNKVALIIYSYFYADKEVK